MSASMKEDCEIQILAVPRMRSGLFAGAYDLLTRGKHSWSGHTAISLVTDDGQNRKMAQGFSPNRDWDMVPAVIGYWFGGKDFKPVDGGWHDDSAMLQDPELKTFGIKVTKELADEFETYFNAVNDKVKKYTLMPGTRSIKEETEEKNCVYSATNVLVDFFYENKDKFSTEKWNDIEQQLNHLITNMAERPSCKQGNLMANVKAWDEVELTQELVAKYAETVSAQLSNMEGKSTELAYVEQISKYAKSKDTLPGAIELTQILAVHLAQDGRTASLVSDWNEIKKDQDLDIKVVDTNYDQVVKEVIQDKMDFKDFKQQLQDVKKEAEIKEQPEEKIDASHSRKM